MQTAEATPDGRHALAALRSKFQEAVREYNADVADFKRARGVLENRMEELDGHNLSDELLGMVASSQGTPEPVPARYPSQSPRTRRLADTLHASRQQSAIVDLVRTMRDRRATETALDGHQRWLEGLRESLSAISTTRRAWGTVRATGDAGGQILRIPDSVLSGRTAMTITCAAGQ